MKKLYAIKRYSDMNIVIKKGLPPVNEIHPTLLIAHHRTHSQVQTSVAVVAHQTVEDMVTNLFLWFSFLLQVLEFSWLCFFLWSRVSERENLDSWISIHPSSQIWISTIGIQKYEYKISEISEQVSSISRARSNRRARESQEKISKIRSGSWIWSENSHGSSISGCIDMRASSRSWQRISRIHWVKVRRSTSWHRDSRLRSIQSTKLELAHKIFCKIMTLCIQWGHYFSPSYHHDRYSSTDTGSSHSW